MRARADMKRNLWIGGAAMATTFAVQLVLSIVGLPLWMATIVAIPVGVVAGLRVARVVA